MAKLHFIFALDRSKSMAKMKEKAIVIFNDTLKALDEETVVTLISFNESFVIDFFAIPPKEVKELTDETYILDGCTAYNDAVMKIINEVSQKTADLEYKMLIISDAQENCSINYSKATVDTALATKVTAGWTIDKVEAK